MRSDGKNSMIKQLPIINGALTTTFLLLLVTAASVDLRKKRIPDPLVLALLAIALAKLFLLGAADAPDRVLGAFFVSGIMLLADIAAPGSFGGGDIKLMAAGGLFLGAKDIFYAFFYALAAAGIYGLCLIAFKKKALKEELAFGPFLTAGMLFRLIFPFF